MLSVNQAVNHLKQGEVLILPTDTLYGLGAIAYDSNAVKKVFDLKKRECSKQLPVHYSSIDMLSNDCVITKEAKILMEEHWPGPLTIVLEKKETSKLAFVKNSVAVRIPNCPILLEIINKLKEPIVMPSANISNEDNIYKFAELIKIFALNGINSDKELKKEPSTIVSFLSGKMELLRKGILKL